MPFPPHRCGECPNCKQLERVQKRVLACVNPPFSSATGDNIRADYGVTQLWNTELARLPCTGKPEPKKGE